MSSFNPTKHHFLVLKITHENCEKYCPDRCVPVGEHLGFDLDDGIYVHVDTIESFDYMCSSDEEFDQLIFLRYLEN